MANIAISELTSEATTLDDNDLLLVSKNNGTSYTSAKMKASVLKNSGGVIGTCKFSSDLIQTACETAITNKNIATNETLEDAISQSFISNDNLDKIISINSFKNNFIDWSQAIEIHYNLTSKSLPFDCLFVWSQLPKSITINSFNATNIFNAMGSKYCYIECGSEVQIAVGSELCYLIPLSYGSIQSDYDTSDITDWLVDGANRSKIDEYFDSIAVYGGNVNNSIENSTQYTNMNQIEGLECKYWIIECRLKVNMIIGSGGKKNANKRYNHAYYVSDSLTPYAKNNGGRKIYIPAKRKLTMTFKGYAANSITVTSFPASFFNNIQWNALDDLLFS